MKRAVVLAAVLLTLPLGAGAATNDPFFARQWALVRLHTEAAWRVTTGEEVKVAVIDTGVDLLHPDLQGRLLPGRDFIDDDDTADDENGHGTHMAGTIAAATGNGIGIASVAPDALILPVRVLDKAGRSDDPDTVAEGIRWAVDAGAQVVNLSLAADGPGGKGARGQDLLAAVPIDLAIRDAAARGAVVVIAAGNDEAGGDPRTAYDAKSPGAIVVGASTNRDRRAAYSNYGAGLDVLAPGGGSATDPDFDTGCTGANAVVGLYWNPQTKQSDYAGACGTSVAVAQVSGIAALLVARGYSNVEVVQRLEATAVDLGAKGRDAQTGFGRVDAARALNAPRAPAPRVTGLPSAVQTGAGVGAAASTPPNALAGPAPPRTPSRTIPLAAAIVLACLVLYATMEQIARSRPRA
jgi:subtilisin family serine protease